MLHCKKYGCDFRESNPGPTLGKRLFYHYTKVALPGGSGKILLLLLAGSTLAFAISFYPMVEDSWFKESVDYWQVSFLTVDIFVLEL